MANMYYELCKYYTDKQNLEDTTQNIIYRFKIAGHQTKDTYETTTIIMNGLLVLLSVMVGLEDHKALEWIKSWYKEILEQSSNDLIQNLHYDLRDCIIHRPTISKQIRNILIDYLNITEQVAKHRSIELIELITNRVDGLTESVSKAIIKLFRINPINHDDSQALVSSLKHICLFSRNHELNVTLKTLSQILANPDRTASLVQNVKALDTNAQELASKLTFYIRAGKEAILILERKKSPSISSTPLVTTFDKEMSIRNKEKASAEAKEKTPDDLQKQKEGPAAPKANQ